MIREANADDKERILSYLRKDIVNCLYIYMDISEFDMDGDMITVWIDENSDGLHLCVMKYFDSFQVYCPDDEYDLTELIHLIGKYHVDRVFSRKAVIQRLSNTLSRDYDTEYGQIMEMKHYRLMPGIERVELASEEDVPEIVELLMSDEENGAAYTSEELTDQLISRIRNKKGRSYVIRDNGHIVTHLGIAAQTDEFLIAALTMVHKDYRNTLNGTIVDSYLMNEISKEGKQIFAFMTDQRRIRMFERMKNKVVAEYGKLILKTT